MKATPSFGLRRFRYIDKRGAYKEDDPTAPGGRKIDLINPRTKEVIPLRANRGWAFDQATFERLDAEGRITHVTATSIMVRRYLHETDTVTPQSVFYQPTRSGSERLSRLLGNDSFDYPKDETVIAKLLEMGSDSTSLILDSFAGSGTTGHAVLQMNKADGGNRKFILIEMDETIARDVTAQRLKKVVEGYTNARGEGVEPLGGGFRFCTLGKPLFDAYGSIDSEVKYNDLAAHVFFSETGSPLPRGKGSGVRGQGSDRGPLLGTFEGRAVYLLFNGILGDKKPNGGNVLTGAVLESLPKHDGPKVIYGEACRLGEARLRAAGVTFKQVPWEVRTG
jgi:adenine-specific DNA-methyltransferase